MRDILGKKGRNRESYLEGKERSNKDLITPICFIYDPQQRLVCGRERDGALFRLLQGQAKKRKENKPESHRFHNEGGQDEQQRHKVRVYFRRGRDSLFGDLKSCFFRFFLVYKSRGFVSKEKEKGGQIEGQTNLWWRNGK